MTQTQRRFWDSTQQDLDDRMVDITGSRNPASDCNSNNYYSVNVNMNLNLNLNYPHDQ